MLAKVLSAALVGIDAHLIDVEVDELEESNNEQKKSATRGLPKRSPILVLLSPKHT